MFSIGYSTGLAFDIAGVWSADPAIITLGGLLGRSPMCRPLMVTNPLAFLAHSMGGLIAQRGCSRMARCGNAYRTCCSSGLRARSGKGVAVRLLEAADPRHGHRRPVHHDAKAATAGRNRFHPPFTFVTIAGDRDDSFPRASSIEPFPEPRRRVVYGNHIEIVKPPDAEHLGYKIALKALTGIGTIGGALDSARLAVESRRFQEAVDTLWPNRADLDDKSLVTLAQALESVGRQGDAIDMLMKANPRGTDPIGVLAGRLKRRWLVDHKRSDAEQALSLYRQALERAETKQDAAQSYYHSINCAFMELAYGSDLTACRAYAQRALTHAAKAVDDVWRRATEGEANLYLGNTAAAVDAYHRAFALNPEPWQATSIYQQAFRAADLVGEEDLAAQLKAMFSGAPAAT